MAAELTRRNWLATVTIKNAPGTDVLAQHAESKLTIAVQTKTSSIGSRKFRLGEKDERPDHRGNEWYAFVLLRGLTQRPRFFIAPRDIVSAVVFLEHRHWLDGRGGRKNPMRDLRISWIEPYEERWDLLERGPKQAPSLLDSSFHRAADRFGLPKDHPGLPAPHALSATGGPLPSYAAG